MRLGRYLVAAGVALLIYANVRLARSRIARRGSSKPSERWRELRPTACDGVRIPRAASIGVRADGTIVPLLRTLGKREELASLANDLNLTNAAAELGVFRGEFSELNMARWRGAKMTLVDTWEASDCVAGNASACVYTNDSRSYDKMVTRLRMERGGPSFAGRWEMVQATTTEAARRYPDGHFDWIYLDATHTYAEARDDLRTWWPKLRVGGLLSGHDYQFQYQARGDGYTFGVKDAVDEFAAGRNLRVYSTSESYLPSFYFLKCEPG